MIIEWNMTKVMFCFALFKVDSVDLFANNLQGLFIATDSIIWLLQCLWRNREGNE